MYCVYLVFLFHQYHEILTGGPEQLWIGDAKHILLVGIAVERIAGLRM